MSKIASVTVDDEIFTKLDNQEIKQEDIFAKSIQQLFENEKQNNEIVTTLQEDIKMLEKQIESLEIDNACVKQENKELNKKIDDLAEMFPSAVTILGKTPESNEMKRNRWIFSKQEF